MVGGNRCFQGSCDPYVLTISANDQASYHTGSFESECYNMYRHSGKVKINSKTLKIGAFFELPFNQGPTAIDSVKVTTGVGGPYYCKMTLVLGGKTYYKVPVR